MKMVEQSRLPKFGIWSLIIVVILTGVAIGRVDPSPVPDSLSLRQEVMYAALVAMWFIDWLNRLTTTRSQSLLFKRGLPVLFSITALFQVWAFWPVLRNLLEPVYKALSG